MNQKEMAKLRYNIMNRMLDHLYADVVARRVEVINNLLRTNNALHGTDCDSFFYAGKKWPENLGYYRCTFNLDKSLEGEMDSFLAWYKPIFEEEYPLVETFIRKILNYSNDVSISVSLFPASMRGILGMVVDTQGITFTSMPMEEVAKIVGLGDKHVNAISFRLMAKLVGA